ncbi:hypothetical protein, partial [Salmonella enterica]|uniref:hypothetical protein n=1 Tax=Salmonella enterica TaxID=28901 RepID=UPI0035CD1172
VRQRDEAGILLTPSAVVKPSIFRIFTAYVIFVVTSFSFYSHPSLNSLGLAKVHFLNTREK